MKFKTEKQKSNQTKSWFFEKINKISKLLTKVAKEQEKARVINLKNERGYITPKH